MNFYTSFILFSLIMCVISKNIVTRSGLLAVAPRAVGLMFFAEVNNTSDEECVVELHPDECCLDRGDAKCDVIQVLGSTADTIPGESMKTLHLVAPLLDPYDRRGFCTIFVDYKTKSKPKNFIRDSVKIQFDTTLRKSHTNDVRICEHIDEDPLNDCKPVYCDTYYNGKRPYFNLIKKRCVEVPVCLSNTNTEVPTKAYNPVSNKCINKPAITNEDINFIKALTGGRSRQTKDILIIKTMDKNCSKTSKNSALSDCESNTVAKVVGVTTLTHQSNAQLTPTEKPQLPKKISRLYCFLTYVASNKHMLLALSGVILLQCCCICAMIYCLTKKCACCKKKEIVNKFFNYRQDASVTTPLICTSNIDTETTDFQYLSESSNYIDKKIRCYKACQKERKTSVKLSMSDDILSKCITRRDWHRLPRSETIPEARIDEHAIERREINLEQRKLSDVKVNFQDEKRETKTTNPISVKSIVKRTDKKSNASLSDSSEKVIRCHSYNNYEGSSNMMDIKKSSHSHGKTFGVYKQEKNTGSIEQGAQAYFSNDSIDDFLSERGVLFIGDNTSKYSFTSISSAGNSSRSSKTSKNNVIRNVIPFLSTKTKGPSSDPGVKKSKADLDLELLHISRASMCSSSNDSDVCKDLKRTKDSTSSL